MKKIMLLVLIITGLFVIAVPAHGANNCSNTVSFGQLSGDAAPAIQAAINAAPNGTDATHLSCFLFAKNWNYNVEGTISFNDRVFTFVDGQNATFRRDVIPTIPPIPKPPKFQQVLINGGHDFQMKNLKIDGPWPTCVYNPQHYQEAGVHIAGTDNVTLNNITILQTTGDGFRITGKDVSPGVLNHPVNVDVLGGSSGCIGRQTISVEDGFDILFQGTYLGVSARTIIDVEAETATQVIDGVVFDGLYVETVGTATGYNFGNLGDFNVSNVTIRNSSFPIMAFKIGDPDNVTDRFNFVIQNNVARNLNFGGEPNIVAKGVDGLVITGNTIPFANPEHAFDLMGTEGGVQAPACNVTMTGNTLTGAADLYDPARTPCNWVDGGGNTF